MSSSNFDSNEYESGSSGSANPSAYQDESDDEKGVFVNAYADGPFKADEEWFSKYKTKRSIALVTTKLIHRCEICCDRFVVSTASLHL